MLILPSVNSTEGSMSIIPHYRIEDPATGLCVRLQATPSPACEAPHIVATLAASTDATRFIRWRNAAEAFARFCAGQPLEIVRVDA